ncbi:MAG: GreA/GreB family elongation factor [Chlamydiia bacterium]|nr:GreA/GreB family elongation factor [Chlamydiia bacterium]
MHLKSFNYTDLFKEMLALNNEDKILEVWNEYKEADDLSLGEFAGVTSVIEKSKHIALFESLSNEMLKIFSSINLFDCVSLKTLNSIANISAPGDQNASKEIFAFFKKRYGDSEKLKNAMQASGLLRGETKGVVLLIDLLMHIDLGKFLYHKNGWGVGEIMKVNPKNGEIVVDFEGSSFPITMPFAKINQIVEPIDENHFLVRRFIDLDSLIEESAKNPITIIVKALQDLGGLKEKDLALLFKGTVVSDNKWASWWAKSRLLAKTSENIVINSDKVWNVYDAESVEHDVSKDILSLRGIERAATTIINNTSFKGLDALKKSIKEGYTSIVDSSKNEDSDKMLATIYAAYAEAITVEEVLNTITESLEVFKSSFKSIKKSQVKKYIINVIKESEKGLEILKQVFSLADFKSYRKTIKEFLVENSEWEDFNNQIESLNSGSISNMEMNFWVLTQKLDRSKGAVPISLFMELIKIIKDSDKKVENSAVYKKALLIFRKDHYASFRKLCTVSTSDQIKDALSSAEECNDILINDLRVLKDIAMFSFPDSIIVSANETDDEDAVWSTKQGLEQAKDTLKQIMSKDIAENTKDIKKAREYGDLRENFEYTSALDKKRELQNSAKRLLAMIKNAKVINKKNINTEVVSVGCKVYLKEVNTAKKTTYTILGPWDVNIEKNIISFGAAIAKTMIGKKIDESLTIKGKQYAVLKIEKYEKD